MNLPRIPIKDELFAHVFSTSGWLKPTYFIWERENFDKDYIFITDSNVFDIKSFSKFKTYVWLIESPVITPKSYNFVYENYSLFDEIFTHSKKIMELPNSHFIPIGMCHLLDNEISLNYQKTKLISMIYSNKNHTEGHSIRHAVATEFNEVIDLMGSALTGKHLKKINACKEYMYSVAIENCKEDYYFSEKILDCFLTGTIPIYWGCPSIGNFFNTKGFFIFNTIEELYNILKDQQYLYDFYMDNQNLIKENYETALKYKIAEDWLFLNYHKYLNV